MGAVAEIRANPSPVLLEQERAERAAELAEFARRVELAEEALNELSEEEKEVVRVALLAECETWLADHPDSPLAAELRAALSEAEPEPVASVKTYQSRQDRGSDAYRPVGSRNY